MDSADARLARLRRVLLDILSNPDLEDEDRDAVKAVLETLDDPAASAEAILDVLRAEFPALVAGMDTEEA